MDNKIEILEKGLFDLNPELCRIYINKNPLKFVHKNIFYGLTKLQEIQLYENSCIGFATTQAYDSRDSVVFVLNSNCQSSDDVLRVYVQQFNKKINKLQLENEKLRHQLKACDGNLDAALTNFHQQKMTNSNMVIMDQSNDSLVIDMLCENEKCVALNFKVPFTNLSMEHEFNKTESIRFLEIHQQQTLFLPHGLHKHFPQLSGLSVTESGLYEIGYRAFEGLDLITLNLTSNKIHEMPVDTFTDMDNLQILDLSFNKIYSLSDDVFANLKSLRQLHLNNNRLKFIGGAVMTPLIGLESVDLSNNVCINMSHPTSTLLEIETEIINVCIAPVELTCRLDSNETSENVETNIYCNVEGLFIECPKTAISMSTNIEHGSNEHIRIFFADKQSIKFMPFQLSLQLPNLKRIEIQHSNLTSLQRTDFAGFSKLTEIVINHNNLSSISDGTFDTIPQLEFLDLSSNAIITLPTDVFSKLSRLQTLILSDNQIVRLMANFLPRKNLIEVFRLDNNKLEFIETKIFRFLRRASLIDLRRNVCIDMEFVRAENSTRDLVELSGEIDLNCSADE